VPEEVPDFIPVPGYFLNDWLAFLTCAELRVALAFLYHGFTGLPGLAARDRHCVARWLGVSTDMLQRTLKNMVRLGMVASVYHEDELHYYLDLSWVPRGRPL
jgi:hypothetical protein